MKKNKVIILASIIVGVLVVTLGLTYAAITFNETKGNSKLVLGDIYMHYGETNQLVLSDAMPMDINDYTTYKVNPVMQSQEIGDNELGRCINIYTNGGYEFDEGSDAESFCKGTGTILDGKTIEEYFVGWQEDAKNSNYDFLEYGGQELLDAGVILSIIEIENLPYFEFTIDGKNTYNKKDIWYEIVLSHGDEHATRTTRIRDDLLRFRLVEIIDETEIVLLNNKKYYGLTNKKIYVDTIPANTNEEINRTYRLYMWIAEDTLIGNVDEDYTLEEWNDVYASIKVGVIGDFIEKNLNFNFVETVKSKVGTDGLVAISTNGEIYDSAELSQTSNVSKMNNGEIREYRYSGRNVNNYVKFNDEIWRIIGVFKDTVKDEVGNVVLDNEGNPTYEEKIKLVKNGFINSIPETYLIKGITYNPSYWNKSEMEMNTNDWTMAGAMYYLNTEKDETIDNPNLGYLSSFKESSRNLISLTTYYLGNLNIDIDTPIMAYESERDENNIHEENKATWNGLISLLYPSDYGYSASNILWNSKLEFFMTKTSSNDTYDITGQNFSWMGHIEGVGGYREFTFLSPSNKNNLEFINYSSMAYGSLYSYKSASNRLLPVLYLKSDTKVIDALGTEDEPYIVVEK